MYKRMLFYEGEEQLVNESGLEDNFPITYNKKLSKVDIICLIVKNSILSAIP